MKFQCQIVSVLSKSNISNSIQISQEKINLKNLHSQNVIINLNIVQL